MRSYGYFLGAVIFMVLLGAATYYISFGNSGEDLLSRPIISGQDAQHHALQPWVKSEDEEFKGEFNKAINTLKTLKNARFDK
jgi:hypothetical protein